MKIGERIIKNSAKEFTKEQLIEFAMYCSGHKKHMIEFRFKEFENKKLKCIK